MRLSSASVAAHNHITNHLSAYIDGALSPRLRRKVERHLDACPACRAELESLRATVLLMRQMPVLATPRSFTLPLSMQAAPARAGGWNVAFGALRVATVAVTMMLVLLLSGDVLMGMGRLSFLLPRPVSAPAAAPASEDESAQLRAAPTPAEGEQWVAEGAQAATEAAPEAAALAMAPAEDVVQVTDEASVAEDTAADAAAEPLPTAYAVDGQPEQTAASPDGRGADGGAADAVGVLENPVPLPGDAGASAEGVGGAAPPAVAGAGGGGIAEIGAAEIGAVEATPTLTATETMTPTMTPTATGDALLAPPAVAGVEGAVGVATEEPTATATPTATPTPEPTATPTFIPTELPPAEPTQDAAEKVVPESGAPETAAGYGEEAEAATATEAVSPTAEAPVALLVAPEPTAAPAQAVPAEEVASADAAVDAAGEAAIAPAADAAAAQARVQRRLRAAMGTLLGVWLILLGGLLWTGYRRRARR